MSESLTELEQQARARHTTARDWRKCCSNRCGGRRGRTWKLPGIERSKSVSPRMIAATFRPFRQKASSLRPGAIPSEASAFRRARARGVSCRDRVLRASPAWPSQGARFAAAGEEATARALAFPLSGSQATPSTRRVIVKKFPFSPIYRPEAEGIVVFAVAHHSRLPGYWRDRVLGR
jgi:hypothetical protein